MRRRVFVVVGALALLAAACGQSRPDRSPLPDIPADLATPVVVDPIPNDGTCVLVVGEGARVLSTDESLNAADIFLPGDIITAVAGTSVTSDQTLVVELQSHRPGDVITFDYQRDGDARQADVLLEAHPDDSEIAILGVRVDTSSRGHAPNDTPRGDLAPERTHLLAVDGSLYFHDPVAAAWQSLDADADRLTSSVVAVEGRLFAVDPSGVGLAPVGGGDMIPLPTSGRLIINLFGVVDGLLLASLAEVSSDNGLEVNSAVVAGIDVAAGEVVWEWDAGRLNGEVVQPVLGITAPDDGLAAITSLVGDIRLHSLLDSTGTVVAGWGTETDFLPVRAIVAGWYDQSTLAFVARTDEQLTLNVLDIADFSHTQLAVLDASGTLRQVWAVGDGRNVVITNDTESRLFYAGAVTPGRLVTRACDVREIAGPVAIQSGLPF